MIKLARIIKKKYDDKELSVLYKKLVNEISKQEFDADDLRILDIGCGAGRDTIYFIKNGYLVDAIDASPKMVFECNKKINDLKKRKDTIALKSGCSEKNI